MKTTRDMSESLGITRNEEVETSSQSLVRCTVVTHV